MNEAEYLMSILGCYPPRPSEISIILHMIQKPNSIIVLLFIQNNFQFKKTAKTQPNWSPLGVYFKISDEHPLPFHMGVPPGIKRSLVNRGFD